jgi:hypothetical protein
MSLNRWEATMETTKLQMRNIRALWAAMAAAVLAGCSGGGADNATVTVQGDVPLTYVKRSTALRMNPTNGSTSAPGGDLMIREKSSPSAPEYNLTSQFTMGVGDASDPEVSYDGKKIVFSMRCPTSNTSTIDGAPACTGRWNIWEYDMTGTQGYTSGKFRRLTASTQDDDVDPAYLPGGRGFVFASNRQGLMKAAMGDQTFYAVDEYERERVLNLHTMDANGGAITQISVNQSHDRNPVVRQDGEIMFSRWEHVGQHNRFAIFQVKPDGTDMFVFYGALSPGNSFLHPREMDPKGKYKGFLASDLMALSRTQEGGSLMFIDAANYSEHNTPANKTAAAAGGQAEVTDKALNQDRGLSPFGRVTTPYPLWDGTDRVLLSYRPCEVTRNGTVIPCANLTAEEQARLADGTRLAADIQADPVQDNAPAAYSIYMFDPAKQTWLLVAAPPTGFMYTDPIPLQARTEPSVKDPTSVDSALAAQNLGLLEVRSVYDTDGLGRMGEGMLAAGDLPAGCGRGIAMAAPIDSLDMREQVADLLSIKDPGNAAYNCAPARFVRAIRAVAPRSGSTGMREAIGETNFEPQQILGYAPIEPDGSFKIQVPADTPLGLTVVDAKGRNIQTHLNWIQVRPGERRTCDGCHSPRRGASLNSGIVVNTLSSKIKSAMSSSHQTGETMASVRTRLQTALLTPSVDMVYTDAWADTTQPGVTARPSILISYANNTNPTDNLQTPVPTNGLINYPDHIAPLWTRDRGANTCITCHNDTRKLDLRSTTSGTGRLTSYEELMLGDPVLDANGLPVTTIRNGVPEIERGPALVDTMVGNALGHTRASRLGEIMFGELLKSDDAARAAHPTPPIDHSGMLNLAEKRLMTEWMDLGGQYYNDLSNGGAGVQLSRLSETVFNSTIMPILDAQCASCHTAIGTDGNPSNNTFRENRFVLTGSDTGDFNVTLTMINDVCAGPSSALLSRPSTAPHPAGAGAGAAVPLPVGSANYNAIASWIAAGCR